MLSFEDDKSKTFENYLKRVYRSLKTSITTPYYLLIKECEFR